jgi:hypothetical protein
MASGTVFMFCASKLILDGTNGVGSRFHDLHTRSCFHLYGGRRVVFSCFALRDSFSAFRRASGPVFLFCAPKLIFGGTEGVVFRFHVVRSRTHFWRFRGCWGLFSCFVSPYSFSAVLRELGPVFLFCAPGHVFAVQRATGPVFMFYAPRLIFGCSEGVRSRFNVLCIRPLAVPWA